MINLRPDDILHKSFLNRILIEIVDHPVLSQTLAFKGGTCAAMLGYLDRFSVDLDFDVVNSPNVQSLRVEFHNVFNKLGLIVTKELDKTLMFQVRYPNPTGQRNSVKISANSLVVKANQYTAAYFPEIDRLIKSQTLETMFANKLVAVWDRYQLHQTIAGRDIYDIHHFFTQGYSYNSDVIIERTGLSPRDYLNKLNGFIKQNITQTQINEDLSTLLPNDKFQQIRKVLLPETIAFLS